MHRGKQQPRPPAATALSSWHGVAFALLDINGENPPAAVVQALFQRREGAIRNSCASEAAHSNTASEYATLGGIWAYHGAALQATPRPDTVPAGAGWHTRASDACPAATRPKRLAGSVHGPSFFSPRAVSECPLYCSCVGEDSGRPGLKEGAQPRRTRLRCRAECPAPSGRPSKVAARGRADRPPRRRLGTVAPLLRGTTSQQRAATASPRPTTPNASLQQVPPKSAVVQ